MLKCTYCPRLRLIECALFCSCCPVYVYVYVRTLPAFCSGRHIHTERHTHWRPTCTTHPPTNARARARTRTTTYYILTPSPSLLACVSLCPLFPLSSALVAFRFLGAFSFPFLAAHRVCFSSFLFFLSFHFPFLGRIEICV